MSAQPQNLYYQRLQIGQNASHEEIVQAYRRLAHGTHPDAHPGDAAAPERFRAITEAYEVLDDARRRAAYDARQLVVSHQSRRVPASSPPTPAASAAERRPWPRDMGAARSGFFATSGGSGDAPLRAGPVRIERKEVAPGDAWLVSDAGSPDSLWRIVAAMLDSWRRR